MGREGDESHDAGALDGFADDALVLHAGAALSTWENFSRGGGESLEAADVLVIKFIDGVSTEVAGALLKGRVRLFGAHTRMECLQY